MSYGGVIAFDAFGYDGTEASLRSTGSTESSQATIVVTGSERSSTEGAQLADPLTDEERTVAKG